MICLHQVPDLAHLGLLGREYTIIRFVLPKELANSLKAYRGKEVELHLRGDHIVMFF